MTYGINGADFGSEMLYLEKVCKNITVRINSVGGSVLDGYGVASSIYNCSVPVTTIIDGLAASTALWCAAAGNIRKAMDYSTGMIHGSTGGEDAAMTELVDKTINVQLSNRSGKTTDEIKSMMEKETWLDAKGLKNMGIVDEIVVTNKKPKIKKTESLYNMASIYNQLINPQMEKVTNILKLKNDASEDSIVSAIESKDAENTTLKAELETVKNKLATLEAEKAAKEEADKTALKNEVTNFVTAANKAGKIKTELMASTIENASKNRAAFDFVKNVVGDLPSSKDSVKIFNAQNAKPADKTSGREEWTIRDWEKKDAKGLAALKNESPEKYNEMYNDFYKK